MKRIVSVIFILTIVLAGCGSSKKQFEKGNYDEAIGKAVKQLLKDPVDAQEIAILDRSYKIANDQDNERLRFLRLEAKPSGWEEIYQIDKRLSDRQSLVRSVTPINLNGKTIEYEYVDYMPEMVAAKRKSADFYYEHGNELMKNNLKDSYRQAYYEFLRAKEYASDYEGIGNKIQNAKYLGMSRVLISLRNTSYLKFPPDFEQNLLAVDLSHLNSEWVEYYIQDPGGDVPFDYFVNVTIRNISVSPDQRIQRDSVFRKTVEDGFKYQLDKRGNVMKDSLGNDIKIKKYKTLQCALIETYQSKECHIDGDFEAIQLNPEKVLRKEPLGARSKFENISARAVGDIQALNQRQLEKTKTQPAPFPGDIEMAMRCSESLKHSISTAVQNTRSFIN